MDEVMMCTLSDSYASWTDPVHVSSSTKVAIVKGANTGATVCMQSK